MYSVFSPTSLSYSGLFTVPLKQVACDPLVKSLVETNMDFLADHEGLSSETVSFQTHNPLGDIQYTNGPKFESLSLGNHSMSILMMSKRTSAKASALLGGLRFYTQTS